MKNITAENILKELKAILRLRTDSCFKTVDYDGFAEDVIRAMEKWNKMKKVRKNSL